MFYISKKISSFYGFQTFKSKYFLFHLQLKRFIRLIDMILNGRSLEILFVHLKKFLNYPKYVCEIYFLYIFFILYFQKIWNGFLCPRELRIGGVGWREGLGLRFVFIYFPEIYSVLSWEIYRWMGTVLNFDLKSLVHSFK